MSTFNLSSMENIIFNGTSLDKVIYNGLPVWEKFVPVKIGEFTSSTSVQTSVDLGFKPKYLCIITQNNAGTANWRIHIYNGDETTTQAHYGYSSCGMYNLATTNTNRINSITNTGFIFNKSSNSSYLRNLYFAIGEQNTAKTASGTFNSSSTNQTTVNIGFKPQYIAVIGRLNNSGAALNIYDTRLSTTKCLYTGASTSLQYYNLGGKSDHHIYSINNDGFTINKGGNYTGAYFAIG